MIKRENIIAFFYEISSRYDKLYLGHDVYFFNDRTGKVERMHHHVDTAGAATSANAVLGSIVINESQQVSLRIIDHF